MSIKTLKFIGIFCAVIIVALVVAGAIVGLRNPAPARMSAQTVDYYCQEGAIVANYASSSVDLSFSDGRTMTLPQTMAGSGIRYASGTIVFWSKGNNAFVTEKDSTTYSNCVAGMETPATASTTGFVDASGSFSFAFPNQFALSSGEQGYTQNWAAGGTTTGIILAEVDIPKNFMPKTNFGDAKFTIGASSDPDAVKNCTVPQFPNMETATSATIGGATFTKLHFGDAGAGNFYDTTSYRIVKGNECYAIEYTIHSSNIDNYPPGMVTAFDEAKIRSILEGMSQSFKFL